MSGKSDFTANEWELLQSVAVGASTAAMNAQEGGEQREVSAIHAAFSRAAAQLGAHALLSDLLLDVAGDPQRLNEAIRSAGTRPFDQQRATLLEEAGRACALLVQKASPEEVEGFQRLIQGIVDSVINAAGEGGSMGFGGPRVSPAEEALLADLNSALTPSATASKTIPPS